MLTAISLTICLTKRSYSYESTNKTFNVPYCVGSVVNIFGVGDSGTTAYIVPRSQSFNAAAPNGRLEQC